MRGFQRDTEGKMVMPDEEDAAEAALARIRADIAKGENIAASDVDALTPGQLENIEANADDRLREMIERMRRESQKDRGHDPGQERER